MKKIAIILSLIVTVSGTQLKVPSAYSTIQAGLNAASSGDTVLVAVGTYTENIIWPDVNGIKLISAGDSSNTIIDGDGNGSVVYIYPQSSTIDSSTLIKGFTIKNGGNSNHSYGGGIFVMNAGLNISYCSISYNKAKLKGGGVYFNNSKSNINNSFVNDNNVYSFISGDGNTYGGGGIYIYESEINIFDSKINNNSLNAADGQSGGGILSESSTLNIFSSAIQYNKASMYGGGMFLGWSKGKAINSSFNFNNSSDRGGGLYLRSNQFLFSNIDIISNSGGAVTINSDSLISHEKNGIRIINNTGPSIEFLGGSARISNILINNNIGKPIDIFNAQGTIIIDSTIISNNEFGGTLFSIYDYSDCNLLIKNTSVLYNVVESNSITTSNLYISDENDLVIEHSTILNDLKDPTYKQFIINQSSSIIVKNSNILSKGYFIDNQALTYSSAINNYWGDTIGPYHYSQNPTSNGAKVSVRVNITPWLTAPDTDAPPIPAQNLTLTASTATSASFSWDASTMSDLSGYKFYYDTDISGYPYTNNVDLGNVVTKSLTGLTAGTKYYIAVTTYDTDGNESWYSKEVSVTMNNTPVIASIPDTVIKEDESITVIVSATDEEGDAITYSAVSDTNAITVSVSSSTLTLTPNANWYGVANIKAYASDGSSKDSTSFKLTVTTVNDAPTAFEWVSSALDTINITQSNLADTYTLQWGVSTDAADGDSITYLLYAGTGASPKEEVYDTTSTSLPIPYQELLQKTFEQIPMLSRATVKFSVSATDGIDTVEVSGDDRVVFVNRYEYLSTAAEGVPVEFALHENYPNPFNPTTTLRFDLPEVSNITLTIYNMLGQKVKTFNMQSTPAGYHSVTWDATNDYGDPVGAGVYLYQLQTKDFVKTRKMVLLK